MENKVDIDWSKMTKEDYELVQKTRANIDWLERKLALIKIELDSLNVDDEVDEEELIRLKEYFYSMYDGNKFLSEKLKPFEL